MKKLQILVLGLLTMTVAVCQSQTITVTNLGTISAQSYLYGHTPDAGVVVTKPASQAQAQFQPMGSPTPPVIAEAITPEIQALADGLQDNPLQIFNYVHDHIKFVPYFCSKKGAELTLLEKSGNDFDQSALLVALLRAAGYSNAGYQFGWVLMPYDNPDGSHRDMHHWLNVNVTNSNWSITSGYLYSLLHDSRAYPKLYYNFDNNTFALQRVWVTVTVGGTNYTLDPAFKVSEPIPGLNLQAGMGFSSNAVMTAAGGQDVGNYTSNFYATNLNEVALSGALTGYTTNLLNYLQSNYPNASVDQVLSGHYIVPSTNTALTQSLLFPTTNMNGTMPVVPWVNEPTNLLTTLTINFLSTSYVCFMPQLQGQRLSLTISSSGATQLWLNDTNVASGNTSGGGFNLTMTVYHPTLGGGWDTTNNVLVPSTFFWSGSAAYQNANASYALLYAFEPDWGWLQERQNQLDAYIQQGYASSSRQVVTETLNIMGLNWMLQSHMVSQALGTQTGTFPFFEHRLGRMGQESGKGYYVDIYFQLYSSSSSYSTGDDHVMRWVDLWSYFASAMEHGLIEQLQTTNLVGASTVKMLELANTNHYAVYLVNSTNVATVETHLVNYTLADVTAYANAGYTLLLPQNGLLPVAGSGSWTGFGLEARIVQNVGVSTKMLIGNGQFGGYSSDLGATINSGFVDYSGYSQPSYFSSAPVSVPSFSAADPVNMADGTFQVDNTDLSLGQTEPRGLNFSRYYSSNRRNSNLAGMAPGWIHNYYLNAAKISAPQAGLGSTTPAQMAPMLAATTAAAGVYYAEQPDPKNWLTTALISKWSIDQLTAKAVSVTLGQSTIQFVQQPDGSFTPPASCAMTLTMNNGAYSLQERHGRTYQFNSAGWGTNIVDPYGQALTLTYNSSNWVKTVTDWKKNRTLTFNYSTSNPQRLLYVADNFGRTVSFGYSSSNDLVTVSDPESKTNRFLYDTNHQIVATFNANGQLVASNFYNAFGRVTTQYTQGDPNKTWHIYWSGWQTVSQDPAGGQQSFFFDDKTRLIAEQDALGNVSRKNYDGQDHVIATVSPLNETNQFVYDGHNNLIQTIDPLNYTNQFFYDGQNNLVQAVDARGIPSTYGYNTHFSLTGQTNGTGDWVNSVYNGDGTLLSRADAGGTTTFDTYDIYGQLTHITYPGSLGGESFINNPFGDPTSHTDARGFATVYQYNLRRQLTNSVATNNLAKRIVYNAVGDVATTFDARGLGTTNTWSATRKLLATALPSTPQGTPIVTNIYDSRDWLIKTLDPLQRAVLVTNDIGGRLIAATDPLLRTVNLKYDADGHTITAINPANETNSQIWDARGKLVKATDGAGHFSTSTFDPAGNLIILTNRNGNKWQFQFDAANRLTNTITPKSFSASLAYNHQRLISTVIDQARQTTALYYDPKGRLTNRTDNVATTLYGYDAGNNLTNVSETINSQLSTLNYSYDAYNRVSSYTDVYGNLIQYKYDANNNLTNLVYPGSKNVYYAYDNLNRLTNVVDWSGRKTGIGYDLNSHVTSIVRPNGSYRTLNYDLAGQTTNVMEQMSNGLPIAIFRYAWTNSGSMSWEFAAPLPHPTIVPTRTMTYDADNRLATFNGQNVYPDADGNLTNAPMTNSTFVACAFDARNRLQNAGGVTNVYDPAGSRIGVASGTNTTMLVVNPNAKLPQVLLRIKNGVTNYYIYGAGLLYQITEKSTGTNTLTYHYDYRGSTVALSADNGAVTDRIEYSAYGLTTYRAGTTDTPFLYNGRFGVMSEPNGLLYMQARYYNPYLCRFINPDPSGFAAGQNFYAYANGNPISFVDPFGLGAVGESMVDLSWFNAPTPEETQIQDMLAGFVNLATLNLANLATSAYSGKDLAGNNLNVDDAFQQTLETGIFVASLALSLPTDGASAGFEETLLGSKTATTLGETTYKVSFGSTGSGLLDSIGLQSARISDINIALDPSLTEADLVNVTAHEGLHASIAQNFPNFAASSGRLPYIGAFPLYGEEVAAYGYGALKAGQYGQALLSPIMAFLSMSGGQTASVLGTGVAAGGLWYYGHH